MEFERLQHEVRVRREEAGERRQRAIRNDALLRNESQKAEEKQSADDDQPSDLNVLWERFNQVMAPTTADVDPPSEGTIPTLCWS